MPQRYSDFSLITAGDHRYFLSILNLIGSVHEHSDIFAGITVYNLGFKPWQVDFLNDVRGVSVASIAAFAPHWRACWSWKPWIWANAPSDKVLYLDAGMEVLRDLSEIYRLIEADGYFLVSQNSPGGWHTVASIMPSDYFTKLGLPKSRSKEDVVAAGIIGFSKNSDFFKKVVEPSLGLSKQGLCLGWSKSELVRNQGINYLSNPPLRDCEVFRHDQTVLNALVYKHYPKPKVQSLNKYAGFKSRNDHPDQLVWHHRRQSSLPYISSISYRHNAMRRRLEAGSLRFNRKIKRMLLRKDLP